MSDLSAQEKRDIVSATGLILVSWLAWFVFGFAVGSVYWAQGF
jgi:hypothetical protein